jgi:hypothetical protein
MQDIMREQEDERLARQMYAQQSKRAAKQPEQFVDYDGSSENCRRILPAPLT